MSFRLKRTESVADGLRRVVNRQAARAINRLSRGDTDQAIHDARRACKKIRGLLRLVQGSLPDYQLENHWYRDAARHLAAARDAYAVAEALSRLQKQQKRSADELLVEQVGRALRAKSQVPSSAELVDAKMQALAAFEEGRRRINNWNLVEENFGAIRAGLSTVYRDGQEGCAASAQTLDAATFHEWRKSVKYLWCQVRFLRGCWPRMIRPLSRQLDELADLLGEDHNLAVLYARSIHPGVGLGASVDLTAWQHLIAAQRETLAAKSRPLGQRIFAESVEAFVARWEAYWNAWRSRC